MEKRESRKERKGKKKKIIFGGFFSLVCTLLPAIKEVVLKTKVKKAKT